MHMTSFKINTATRAIINICASIQVPTDNVTLSVISVSEIDSPTVVKDQMNLLRGF